LNLASDGSFTYTPTSAYSGSDSFTYRAFDGTTNGNIATVTITDIIKPTAVDVQATNTSGGTIGHAEPGDTVTYTFSEPIDPSSIIAGWDGTGSRNVVVRVYDGDILLGILGGNDSLQVFDAANYSSSSQALSLGTVDLGGNSYVTGLLGVLLGSHIRYGSTATASTMMMSADKKTVSIVLGAASVNGLVGQGTETNAGTMTWTPTTGPKDLAGNALVTTPATESGTADRDF
ncbi:MAG: hypothetical protein JWR34_1266, partial [Mycobacterium sp.]|nr:hypothetical protein [Mycobacterium sp.]